MGHFVYVARQICTTKALRTHPNRSLPCKLRNLILVPLPPFSHPSSKQDADVSINAKKEPRLINPSTGDYLELDIYFPSLQLAFEYQVRSLSSLLLPPPLHHNGLKKHFTLHQQERHHWFTLYPRTFGSAPSARQNEDSACKEQRNHIDTDTLLVGWT